MAILEQDRPNQEEPKKAINQKLHRALDRAHYYGCLDLFLVIEGDLGLLYVLHDTEDPFDLPTFTDLATVTSEIDLARLEFEPNPNFNLIVDEEINAASVRKALPDFLYRQSGEKGCIPFKIYDTTNLTPHDGLSF